MADTIPKSHLVLFERPIVAALGTVLPNGQPQVQPVWCSYDGRQVLVNTVKGRAKYANMHARPKITLLLIDPDDVYYWIEVRGTVVEETTNGADAHIDQLARKYLGAEKYPWAKPEDTRVIFKIAPRRVVTLGPN